MDPDVTLAKLIECARWEQDRDETSTSYAVTENAGQMAEWALDLHEWLSMGGMAPKAWTEKRSNTVYLVQRDDSFDGLYGFVIEEQADEYAELFPGAERGEMTIISPEVGRGMIDKERAELVALGEDVVPDDEEDDQ